MAGVNPYIKKLPVNRPTKPYTVTFIDEATGEKKTYRMDPATFPFGHIGLDGSLLAIAEEAGVEINHSCGGVCACSTCHVYVQKGAKSCSPASEDEEDELDKAPAVTPDSRSELPVRAGRVRGCGGGHPEVEPQPGHGGSH